MRYITPLLLLMAGFALTTAGLMGWRDAGFGFDGFWPPTTGLRLLPLLLLVLGLATLPPAFRRVFLLERRALGNRRGDPSGGDRTAGRT